jgi:hypothetical protein
MRLMPGIFPRRCDSLLIGFDAQGKYLRPMTVTFRICAQTVGVRR